MAMTMKTARVRTTIRAVRKGPDNGCEGRMGRGMAMRLRMGRGKERGRGRATVKENVLYNTPQGEIISLVLLLCSCRRK
jgi:hypothetical protein